MSQKKISSVVILLHLLVIVSFLFTPQRKVPQTHHVAIRTHLRPPKSQPKTVAATKPSSSSSSARPKKTAPKSAPKPKAESKPSPNKKKMTAVESGKKAKSKKAAPPPPVAAAVEAEEIAPKPEKRYSGPKFDIPAPIGALQIDQTESPSLFSVEGPPDEVISFLHGALHLPDFGEVKIELTLGDNGVVNKVVVLKSESAKNKAYLEKQLPLLKFPKDMKSQTLILTFCNEI